MKVTGTQTVITYNPVSINVTFETNEEYEMFSGMLSWNVSIPELVYRTPYDDAGDKQKALGDMMQNIHDTMTQEYCKVNP